MRYSLSRNLKVTTLVLAILAMFAATGLMASNPQTAPDHIHLTWQHDPTTTMTIMWRTNRTVGNTFVEYGTDQNLGTTESGDAYDYGDNNARMHVVELTGLEPDSVYYYRCGSGTSGMSEIYTFATPPSDPCSMLRFIVVGDSRASGAAGASSQWADVAAAAATELPDFITINGDLINDGDVESGWDQFFEYAHPHIAQIPLIPTWGNHDNRSGSLFPDIFKLPEGPQGQDYFALDIGVLHLLMLDSEHGDTQYQSQVDWMNQHLPDMTGKWILAMSHRPAYSSSTTHGSEPDIQQYFVPAFEQNNVDVYFGSHDHIYERTCAIRNNACVESLADGILYYVTGGAGAFMNPVGGMDWFTREFFAQHHYILVEIGFDSIDLTTKDYNGNIRDHVAWTRANPIGPVATITATPNPVKAGEPVTLDGTGSSSCGGTIESYIWELGDGNGSPEGAFPYIYSQPGTYQAVLTVIDDDYMTGFTTAEIVVEESASDDDDDDDNDDWNPPDESGDDDDDDDSCGC